MQTVNGNIQVKRGRLSKGPEGIDETVSAMMDCAMGEYGMRSSKIRALALNIVRKAHVKQKDYYGEIVAIHNYVRDNIRYTRDVVNQETISQPEETAFNSMAEDCDGQATLEIALLGSIGIRAVPVVIGMRPNSYSHVYLMAVVPAGKHRRANDKIMLDPIMTEWKAGREAPANKIKAKKIYTQYLSVINPEDVTMNSGQKLPLSISDQVENMGGFGALGAYAEADDYLDYHDEEAVKALLGDKDNFPTGRDWIDGQEPSVTITSTVDAPAFGVDGMMGGSLEGIDGDSDYTEGSVSYATVLQSQRPAPIRGPYGTGPLGPVDAVNARSRTHYLTGAKPKVLGTPARAIPLGRPNTPVNPIKEVIRRDPISGRAQVVGVRKSNHVPNQAIVLNEGGDYQCAMQASLEAKSNFQEAAEIDGLDGFISDMDSSVALAGLGNEGSESDVLDEAAIVTWVASYKACKAAAAAKLAEAKEKVMKKNGAPLPIKAIVAKDAAEKKKIAAKAKKVAKKAIKVEHKIIAGQVHRAAQAKAIQEELDENNAQTNGMLGEFLAGGDAADDVEDKIALAKSKGTMLGKIRAMILRLQKRLRRLTSRNDIASDNQKVQIANDVRQLKNRAHKIMTTPASRENAALRWKKLKENRPKLAARIKKMKERLRNHPQTRAKIAGKVRKHVQNAASNGMVDKGTNGMSGIDIKSPKVYVPAAAIALFLATR